MGFGGLSNYIACNIFAAEIRLWSLEFAIYSKSRMRHDQSLNLGSQLKYIKRDHIKTTGMSLRQISDFA